MTEGMDAFGPVFTEDDHRDMHEQRIRGDTVQRFLQAHIRQRTAEHDKGKGILASVQNSYGRLTGCGAFHNKVAFEARLEIIKNCPVALHD